MKRLIVLLLGALALCLPAAPAAAQTVSAKTVSVCGTPGNTPVVGSPYPITQDTTGALCMAGGGGGGGGGAVTAAAGSYALGAIVDIGTGPSPAANTVNAYLKALGGQLPLSLGLTTKANSLSVTFASDQTLPAFAATPTFNLGTLNGAALAANQPTINADAGAQVHVMNFPGTQPSSLADGSDTTLGSKADAATCATTNSAIACFRQLHLDLIAATPDTAAGDFAATRSNTTNALAVLGAKGDTVCATDTGSCSANAQLQRAIQKLTSLLAVFPTTLDTNTGAPGASTLRTVPAAAGNIATAQTSCATTATQIVASRAARLLASIENTTTTDIYVGGSGVTTSTGQLLPGTKGASLNLASTAALYCIVASGTATVTSLESY